MSPELLKLIQDFGAYTVLVGMLLWVFRWILTHVSELVKTNKEISVAFKDTVDTHMKATTALLERVSNHLDRNDKRR